MTKKELGNKIYEIEKNNPMGVYYGHFTKKELLEEIEKAKERAERKVFEVRLKGENGIIILGKGTTKEAAIFSAKATAKKSGILVRSIWLKNGVEWKKI